jgi:hypothetical protein
MLCRLNESEEVSVHIIYSFGYYKKKKKDSDIYVLNVGLYFAQITLL